MGVLTAPEGTFTIEQFKRLPLEGRRWELLDGVVRQMEPHVLETSHVTATLLSLIGNHVHGGRLGVILDPGCGYRLWPGRETVRVTDGSFTHHRHVPADRDRHEYPHWPPDLIVEVISPVERMATVIGRVAMFLQAGTQLVWIVDPASQTVSTFRQDSALPTMKMGEMLHGGDVLPGFSVPVAEIFR